jgi:hypothetical protein
MQLGMPGHFSVSHLSVIAFLPWRLRVRHFLGAATGAHVVGLAEVFFSDLEFAVFTAFPPCFASQD